MSQASQEGGVLEYGPNITLGQAKRVMAAAEAKAAACGWATAIAIVDTGARLVMLHKMDHTQIGSILVAEQKAETAVSFKRPSKVFEEAVAQGGVRLRTLGMPNVIPVEGGIPLMVEGRIIGAIGVSGVQSTQDAEVAEAGAAAL